MNIAAIARKDHGDKNHGDKNHGAKITAQRPRRKDHGDKDHGDNGHRKNPLDRPNLR